ncbi:MAG TPA: hypothetical protein VFG69_05760 [Nannocystaceae bacterium]|nr:hypothetical protein [Nannocystaceae bacterium]
MNVERRDRRQVAAELAALGEPEPEAFETPGDDADVDGVVAMFGLVHGVGPELSELERRRVWRRVQAHGVGVQREAPRMGTWAGIAAAAALVLVPVFAPQLAHRSADAGERAAWEALGQQARRSLGDLPGGQDRQRARALADDYAARLQAAAPVAPTEGSER